MPKIRYAAEDREFRQKSLDLIDLANEIIADYEAQGFGLTLRQLYYQMVSRDIIPNNQKSYDNLGSLINDARLYGLIDWLALDDRTRPVHRNTHWKSPEEIIKAAASGFAMDKWQLQKYRPEVWVEKEALVDVVGVACEPLDVPYFACKGYTSQSKMWQAGQRIRGYLRDGYEPVIFYLGDHDPSGLDMTRDVTDRLRMFVRQHVRVERLALNWDQIQRYDPPPNPAKLSDSRAAAYIEDYGEFSYELDALSPAQTVTLVEDAIADLIDDDMWAESEREETEHKTRLQKASDNWIKIVRALDKLPDKNTEREDADDEYEGGQEDEM